MSEQDQRHAAPRAADEQVIHRIPVKRVVDRATHLASLGRNKDVIHLGFVDVGRMNMKLESGTWLHARLAGVARNIVGIDLDADGVAAARRLGYEAFVADCADKGALEALGLRRADVVIASEIIEHVGRAAAFLDAMKVLLAEGGTLVLTTPNATGLFNLIAALARREFTSPDHVAWYSWRTMTTLLERGQWETLDFLYYAAPRLDVPPGLGSIARKHLVFNTVRRVSLPLLRVWPTLSEGLIVVVREGPQGALGRSGGPGSA